MSAYLLNLVFTQPASATTATGLFTHDNPTGLRSKVWYTVGAGWPPVPLTEPGSVLAIPPLVSWGTPVPDGSLSCALGDNIYIRVVPDSSWGPVGQPVPGLGMVFGLGFGRLATSNHGDATLAAPFTHTALDGAGVNTPLTYFTTPPSASNPPAGDGSWMYYCGQPTQNAPGQKAIGGPPINTRVCTYSFTLGAQAYWGTGNHCTYGHDPSLVVKG